MEVVGRDRRVPAGGRRSRTEPVADDRRHRRQPLIRARPHHDPRKEPPMTRAMIATEIGDIDVDLFTDGAPKAAQNFVDLAKQGLLRRRDLPPRHPGLRDPGRRRRARQEGVAQRGRASGPAARATSSRTSRSPATTTAARSRWRTPGPNTNGSQFFICHQDLVGKLPKNYTIFGQVTKGLDVVDQIANAPRELARPARLAGRDDVRHDLRRGLKLARLTHNR